jgi:hypothetical protein
VSTDDIKKSTDVVKSLLNNQYGGAGVIIGFIVMISTLAPDRYAQIKDFTAHAVDILNKERALVLVKLEDLQKAIADHDREAVQIYELVRQHIVPRLDRMYGD